MPTSSSSGAPKRGKNLSPEQVRAIAESIADGERHSAIAARFGVSAQTVGAIKSGKRGAKSIDDTLRAKMHAASIAPRPDAVRAKQVMAALEAGRSGRAVAREFGISASMVSAIKHGHAWTALDPELPTRLACKPREGKALVAAQVARIKRSLLAGKSTRAVAAEFGVSASTVQSISRGRTWAEVAPASSQ